MRQSSGFQRMINYPRLSIQTHGCKLNQADSLQISMEFEEAGFTVVGPKDESDVHILNTCTVTHIADRKARQAIRAVKRIKMAAKIIVTGCYAERDSTVLERMPEVDLVVGNSDKESLIPRVKELFQLGTEMDKAFPDFHMLGLNEKNRAMVKIQEGCNQVCSYCIVPKVRGRERSVPVSQIISRINKLTSLSCKEVILTGTQLGSYGFDLKNVDLASLIREVLSSTDVPRVRVSSIQPQEINSKLLDLWSNPRLCPHFHVPLQSGSSRILAAMRRRYDASKYIEALELIRHNVADVSITTDVIVGFPGETDNDFNLTKEICKVAHFSDMHIFKFSNRPGTSAYYLEDTVAYQDKSSRSGQLMDISRNSFAAFRNKFAGRHRNVLWENQERRGNASFTYFGLTDNYIRVITESNTDLKNMITSAHLTRINSDLYGPMIGVVSS